MENETTLHGAVDRAAFYEILKTNGMARDTTKTLIENPDPNSFGANTPLIMAIAGATGAHMKDVVAFLTDITSDEQTIIDGNFIGRLAVSE